MNGCQGVCVGYAALNIIYETRFLPNPPLGRPPHTHNDSQFWIAPQYHILNALSLGPPPPPHTPHDNNRLGGRATVLGMMGLDMLQDADIAVRSERECLCCICSFTCV